MKWRGTLFGVLLVIITGVSVAVYQFRQESFPGPLQVPDIPSGDIQLVASHLDSPWSVVFYNQTALISSRNTGEILEITASGGTRVVGRVEEAVHRGEGGLLGLAVKDSQLYAYYTTDSDNRIAMFDINGEPGRLSLAQKRVILSGLPAASIHNGGRIDFGPDGMLYATVGDAGDTSAAQDLSQYHGKILRITPDGDAPIDNPFQDSLVYSYGHRNPQGITWASDGTMFSSEFGQNTWDELNIINAGGNYGWPAVEGIGSSSQRRPDSLYADPVQQWEPASASPSGITYADGTIFIANLRGSLLRTVSTSSLEDSSDYFKDELGRIRDVTIAPDGRLWLVTNNTDGRGSPGLIDDRILSISIEDL